jgi:hypothetical protein
MYSNFYEASIEYPRENFEQIAARMLGNKGFPARAVTYKSECRKAFDLGRNSSRGDTVFLPTRDSIEQETPR